MEGYSMALSVSDKQGQLHSRATARGRRPALLQNWSPHTAVLTYQKGRSMMQPRSSLSPVTCMLLAVVTSTLLIFGSATPSFASSTFYTCKSVDVSAYAERVHVHCDRAASGGIVFFAVPTAN